LKDPKRSFYAQNKLRELSALEKAQPNEWAVWKRLLNTQLVMNLTFYESVFIFNWIWT